VRPSEIVDIFFGLNTYEHLDIAQSIVDTLDEVKQLELDKEEAEEAEDDNIIDI
jgi:hypothetical protein